MDLGHVNVDAMLRTFTAKQLAGWIAYFKMDPFGEAREDWRNAKIVQMLYNANVKKGDQKELKEFLLDFLEEEAPRRQGPKEHARIIRALFAAYNAPPAEGQT